MPEQPSAVVEDTSNRFFAVRSAPGFSHAWIGIAVKRTRDGFVPKAGATEQLVRIAGCRIVEGRV